MENNTEIKHNKQSHNLYILVGFMLLGILILQPISMVILIAAQTMMQ